MYLAPSDTHNLPIACKLNKEYDICSFSFPHYPFIQKPRYKRDNTKLT